LMQFSYFICPVQNLGANVWTGLQCTPNPVFSYQIFNVPFWLKPVLGATVEVRPIQFHIIFMATFASLIAPFGGFFASGLKRTFNIKDFGETIPGHGGITDRMDCQFIMGFFSYVYYQSFIAVHNQVTVGAVLESVVTQLSLEDQLKVVQGLHQYLAGQGILDQKMVETWNSALSLVVPARR